MKADIETVQNDPEPLTETPTEVEAGGQGETVEEIQVLGPETPPDPTPVPEPDAEGRHDLARPEYYLNRELTWLNFNFRVLNEPEAQEPQFDIEDQRSVHEIIKLLKLRNFDPVFTDWRAIENV